MIIKKEIIIQHALVFMIICFREDDVLEYEYQVIIRSKSVVSSCMHLYKYKYFIFQIRCKSRRSHILVIFPSHLKNLCSIYRDFDFEKLKIVDVFTPFSLLHHKKQFYLSEYQCRKYNSIIHISQMKLERAKIIITNHQCKK